MIQLIRSEIEGEEGKIVTYTPQHLGKRFYFSFSEVKWHDGEKYKRMPIWFAYDKEIPGLCIGKLAIFYDKRADGLRN